MMVGSSCILIRRHREGSNRLVSEVDSTFCRSNYASFIAKGSDSMQKTVVLRSAVDLPSISEGSSPCHPANPHASSCN